MNDFYWFRNQKNCKINAIICELEFELVDWIPDSQFEEVNLLIFEKDLF
jgi:hypothetical protein